MEISSIKILEIIGMLFVIVAGTLMHFAFDKSGKNPFVGIISPVNESTWEHLKLLFFPMLFYTIIEYFAFGKDIESFINAKSAGIILGLIAIVVIFYTYTEILGTNYLWADILTFIIGVFVAFGFSWYLINNRFVISNVPFLVLIFILFCFIIFTFYPPHVILFLDPITLNYGIPKIEK